VPNGFALAGAVALALSFLLPMPAGDGRILHLPSVCPFHELTGLPCPGCGLTRSFVCLAHGHLAESLRYHPLGPLIFASVAATVLFATLERISPSVRIDIAPNVRRFIPMLATAIVLTAWLARMAGFDPLPG
jgi:hypothetical protein